MKKRTGLLFTVLLLGILFGTCFLGTAKASAAAKTPAVSATKKTLYVGYNTYKVQLKNTTKQAVVTYTTSNKKVAAVSKTGVISPKAAGTAVITVTINQNKKTYKSKVTVTVKNPYILITNKVKDLQVNDAYVFTAKAYGIKKPNITWSIDNTDIAEVDKETGVVAVAAEGIVKVTATDKVTGKNSSCTVVVYADMSDEKNRFQISDNLVFIKEGELADIIVTANQPLDISAIYDDTDYLESTEWEQQGNLYYSTLSLTGYGPGEHTFMLFADKFPTLMKVIFVTIE